MRSRGIVKSNDKVCKVAIIRQSVCGENCANCGGCTLSETEIIAENEIGAKIGDKVVLEISDKVALGAAWLAYMLPLVLMITCFAVCSFMKISEKVTIIISIAVFILSMLGICFFAKVKAEHFKVKIIEIIN